MQKDCETQPILEITAHDPPLLTQNEAAESLQTKADALVTVCRTLESLVDEFLRDLDQHTTLTSDHTCCEREGFDPLETLGCMRTILKSSLAMNDTLRTFSERCSKKLDHFDEKIDELQRHINRSAMHYGMKRLPDELLLEILSRAIVSFESMVALSHVCRRFRSIIIGTRKLWRGYFLSSKYPPDKILAIAERSGFQSLQARIGDEYLNESTKTILGLHEHLEKLFILTLTGSFAEVIEHHAGDLSFPVLRLIFVYGEGRDHDPLSQFPALCYAPRLEDVCVGFIPHPSLAGNLTQCSLLLPSGYLLRDLLEFLSFTTVLQELTVSVCTKFTDQENAHVLKPISLQRLVCLRIWCIKAASVVSARTFTEKISSDAVEKLELQLVNDVDIGVYFTRMQTKVSIRELQLELRGFPSVDLGHILSRLPDHIEVLAFDHLYAENISAPAHHETVRPRRLRIIRFQHLGRLSTAPLRISDLRDFLLPAIPDTICIEFLGCPDVKDGTYALNDLESAFDNK